MNELNLSQLSNIFGNIMSDDLMTLGHQAIFTQDGACG